MKKKLSLVLATLMLLGLLAGCGGQPAASGDKDTVVVYIGDIFNSMTPYMTTANSDQAVFDQVYETLTVTKDDGTVAPRLAKSWKMSDDCLEYTFQLEEGVKFHNGEVMTADDVVYSFEQYLANPAKNNFVSMIDKVEMVDANTVKVTLNKITPLFLVYINELPILNKKFVEEHNGNISDVACGTGPYKFVSYQSGVSVVLEKNEDYFQGAPKIDKLNIKIVDGSQLYAGLQSGEIDITQQTMSDIPQEDYESVEALDNVDVVYGSPVTNQSVFIQTKNVPDVKVRQAMLYAIDRQQILEELLNGHGEIVDGFLSSASPFYDDSLTPVSYDPEKAKTLLEEAGWDGSQTIRFYVNSGDSTFVNAASIIAAEWAAVGIKAEIQTVDFATLMSVAGTEDYDVLAVQYTYAPVDPYPDVAWLLGGEGSWTGYSDDTLNDALTKSQLTSDPEETKELFSVVDKKVQEDVPMFSAYVISAQGAVSKRITGAAPSVYGFFNDVQNWDVVE